MPARVVNGAFFRPTHERPIGYVFQEASLFPHLSVKGNLLYGARDPRPPASADHHIGFDEVVNFLALAKLLNRAPNYLSGGERQRVAIGRALLSQPKLLLMDEPLSALDHQSKEEILPFLERLRDSLSLPVIYVSHDMREVERLADSLVLMAVGGVRAAGPLAVLQSDPSLPLATARDAAVTLDAVVEGLDPDYGLVTLSVSGGRLVVPMPPSAKGERHRLQIAAGDVSLARQAPGASTILNILPVRVIGSTGVGEHEVLAVLGLGPDGSGSRLLARVTERSWEQVGLSEGASVYALIKSVALAPAKRP